MRMRATARQFLLSGNNPSSGDTGINSEMCRTPPNMPFLLDGKSDRLNHRWPPCGCIAAAPPPNNVHRGRDFMLKHLAIAAGSAALLVGFSAGYLFATTSLSASRSNVYKTAGGQNVSYTMNLTIDHGTATLTVAERKDILSKACAQAAQDIK
jgi:hypothetical protein